MRLVYCVVRFVELLLCDGILGVFTGLLSVLAYDLLPVSNSILACGYEIFFSWEISTISFSFKYLGQFGSLLPWPGPQLTQCKMELCCSQLYVRSCDSAHLLQAQRLLQSLAR